MERKESQKHQHPELNCRPEKNKQGSLCSHLCDGCVILSKLFTFSGPYAAQKTQQGCGKKQLCVCPCSLVYIFIFLSPLTLRHKEPERSSIMLSHHAVGSIMVLHSKTQACYQFLFFQKVNRKHRVLLLGEPSPFPVGQILQARAQQKASSPWLCPLRYQHPLGQLPELFFSLCSPARGERRQLGFATQQLTEMRQIRDSSKKKNTPFSRNKHYLKLAVQLSACHLNSGTTNMKEPRQV